VLISYFGIFIFVSYFSTLEKTLNNIKHKIFLELLYQVRVTAGMTQKTLAEKLDVPQSFISKVETGERRLDIIELSEVCRCLNITLGDFVKTLEHKINESR
jgi:transcriptional regulator with XRE-family HTH domain